MLFRSSVHSKVMLVDDAWGTIGSCNLHAGSLFRNTEMNVSFWDPACVRALRCELLAEHLGEETRHLDDLAALARTGVPVVVELHGDWRTATRLYGSPARRVLAPLADRFAAFGLTRAAAVRTVSPYTSSLLRELGVEPAAEFAAFMDLELFLDRPPVPLPDTPRALFVGVLELYKNIDGLAAVWRSVARQVPNATLRIVGRGSQYAIVEQLVAE